jgi:hypothetical protein
MGKPAVFQRVLDEVGDQTLASNGARVVNLSGWYLDDGGASRG